jgi:hypothetical protein
MQRIDKPTIYDLYNAFWNRYPASHLPDRRHRAASFASSRPSWLGDDEASSEFRPKIATVQNLVTLD